MLRKGLGVGATTDAAWAKDPDTGAWRVIILGTAGAAWLDPADWTTTRLASFPGRGAEVQTSGLFALRDLDGDGVPEAVQQVQFGLQQVSVLSTLTGMPLVSMHVPLESAGGFRGGQVEFVGATTNGEGSWRLFVRRMAWRDAMVLGEQGAEPSWQNWGGNAMGLSRSIDLDGDGSDELVYADMGEIVIRDWSGKLLGRTKPSKNATWVQGLRRGRGSPGSNGNQLLISITEIAGFLGLSHQTRFYGMSFPEAPNSWKPSYTGPLSKNELWNEEFLARSLPITTRGDSWRIAGNSSQRWERNADGRFVPPFIIHLLNTEGAEVSKALITDTSEISFFAKGGLVTERPLEEPSEAVIVAWGDTLYRATPIQRAIVPEVNGH